LGEERSPLFPGEEFQNGNIFEKPESFVKEDEDNAGCNENGREST
jgi:hypothetical protein